MVLRLQSLQHQHYHRYYYIHNKEPHGFVVGNKLTVKDSNDAGLADLIITGITTDTVTANAGLGVTLHGPKYLLKNGIASNDLTSDKDGENLGSRGLHSLVMKLLC